MLQTKDYKNFSVGSHTFAGARLANKCLPGDLVEPTETGCVLKERAQHPILAGLIELNSKVRYGFSSRNVPIYLFVPFNESYPPFVVGCSERDTTKNRLALVKFDAWKETYPRGLLQQLLPIGADEEALFWTYSPLACVKYKGDLPPPAELTGRRPLRGQTFHIDPPGCRDVDDVLSIEYVGDWTYITITIADVAASVPAGHPLDMRAAAIGQTFYQDGNEPKHMFPAALSEEAMSLLPGQPKPGLSLRFPLANPTDVEWFESVVQTDMSFTYDSVYQNTSICDTLALLSTALGQPSTDSHEWIEAAMKFYNTEAAKLIQKARTGLLRSHQAPAKEKLQKYTAIDPALKFLAYSSAVYVTATDPEPHHWGLNAAVYTHASSPIRRYADLVNQRVIKAYLTCSQPPQQTDPQPLNQVARQAKKHDRDLIFVRALQNATTGRTTGQIINIQKRDTDIKLHIYVPTWQLVVKLTYAAGPDENTVITKDEKTVHEVAIGLRVLLSYHADMTARSWKKRIILRLTEELRLPLQE
jgi:exoribonuclease R